MANTTNATQGTGRGPRIGIVGAGLAGLRCADILAHHGFDVTIIEARDRVGGRMTQQQLPNGRLVDLGPNWIHGTEDNPMLDLAKQTGTCIADWETAETLVDDSGRVCPAEEGDYYFDTMWEIILEAFDWSNEHGMTIPVEESLWDFFLRKVPEKIPESEDDYERKREMLLQVSEGWGTYIGTPVTQQSLRHFWLEECVDGDNLFCTSTYRKILEFIAKPAKEKATILYNTRVRKIEMKTANRDKPLLLMESGQRLEFDEVVFTAPLGWLKRNLDAFDPPLPARIQQGIHAIGYGCLEKVYISFPKAFWQTPDKEGRVTEGFCHWLSPSYDKTNPNKWTQECVELASASADGSPGHPTLLFYTFGDQSKHITEKVASFVKQEDKDAFLYDTFRPYFSRLPGYNPASDDCKPSASLSTGWLLDDLAGNGSYSNFQVGLEQADQDIQAMREGVPKAGLWLAGEHTAPFDELATATGAYWSGEAVARRIAEAYGKVVDEKVEAGDEASENEEEK
ncbi:Amine oxidase family member 1 [Colletotrichum chlorophyti]|uniref:Amine oxidase family member 1 n=1 Tax=Colletotrichum chlorophyti TaxID=708187 RepID=A0A1Q8RUQ7_9PEZI|nr:Amine oxidase family member 1 [Colletotrichum chlorophyti]